MHRVLLDRNPKAADPDDRSIHGAAPPDVVASEVVPPIVADDREVTFVSPGGRVVKRIRLDDDPNIAKTVYLSPGGVAVAIKSGFSSRVNASEVAEGGEWPARFTVFDRSGTPVLTTTGGTDQGIHVADTGAVALSSVFGGQITFVDSSTGAHLLTTDPLGPFQSGRPMVTISASGERVLVVAPTTSLDGDRRGPVILKNLEDYRRRSVREVWASLFDGRGNRLWLKQLPGAAILHNVALSDDGNLAYVLCEGPNRTDTHIPVRGFLLDGHGGLVGQSDTWGGGLFDAPFQRDVGGFVLGSEDADFLDVLHPDGHLEEVFFGLHRIPGAEKADTLRRSIVADRVALLARRKSRVVLVLMDRCRQIQLMRHIGGQWLGRGSSRHRDFEPDEGPRLSKADEEALRGRNAQFGVVLSKDGTHVAIRMAREIRVFRILPRGSRNQEAER